MFSCPISLSDHSHCSMASSLCLFMTCCHHLNQHVDPTTKLSINKSFKAKKNSIICARKRCILKAKRTNNTEANIETDTIKEKKERRVRILIAGGGIGGLVLALAAKQSGFEVMVFEKDLSAVRGEGRHRGPIQLLSSALGILVDIDRGVADQIMDAGCVTGNRVNGLADGLSGNWLAKYDLMAPATKARLPATLVICRMTLQEILLNAVGSHIVFNKSKVVDFSQDHHKVVVTLDDGRKFEGDILVGADGIWSEVRTKLFGAQEASYSGYTCYSGLAEYIPSYINSIGYRVFLGSNQYFVACDVGNGNMQWYAFHKEAPRCISTPEDKKIRLVELFECWCSDVTTLIAATREDMIFRRDIYDRDMIYSWGIGRVTLLGDAAHPMQPNLGQGGCLAIEDCRQLILELESIKKHGFDATRSYEIPSALKRYEQKRILRTKIVHIVSRVASKALSGYQPFIYLWTLRLPHIPFQVFGFLLRLVMPYFMTWLLTYHCSHEDELEDTFHDLVLELGLDYLDGKDEKEKEICFEATWPGEERSMALLELNIYIHSSSSPTNCYPNQNPFHISPDSLDAINPTNPNTSLTFIKSHESNLSKPIKPCPFMAFSALCSSSSPEFNFLVVVKIRFFFKFLFFTQQHPTTAITQSPQQFP
ncbi:hypothetical protein L1987_59123 [Smallanthus sonchifolius]|uniref:Uncharacterized protein n=1 Tax=Smallanthus sonchifolius TaxID=185202 RepID=A0ACB9D4F0_9ASTR|nr:hypothetical protein L1987_59123 [Smallanthus sonchifolius]